MPESTATIDAPAVAPSFNTAALDAFQKNMEAQQPEQTEAAPAPEKTVVEQPAAKTAKAAPTEKASEFPDEFMGGKKVAPKRDAPASAPDLEFLQTEPHANSSEKTKINWKAQQDSARKAIEARESENAKLKAELEALRKGGSQPSEEFTTQLESERKARTELEQRLERVAFEQSPRFQQFVKAENAEIESAKGYLEGSDISPNVIELAARATGAKRIAALKEAGLDTDTIAAIAPHLAHVDAIRRERDGALENWKQTNEQWTSEQKRQQEQQTTRQKEEEDRVFGTVGAEVAKHFEPFQKVEGHEAWNTQVDKLQSEAKKFFNGEMELPQLAEIAYYGIGAKVVHKMFHSLREKYNALVSERDALKAAQPGGSEEHRNEDTGKPKGNASFQDAALHTFREQQQKVV